MSERAVGFLVSALIHLGLLWSLVAWLGMRTPELPVPRPVALTLAMFQDEVASPATPPPPVDTTLPAVKELRAEPPPPPAAQEIPVRPQSAPLQQTPPEPRQARVNREPIAAAPPVRPPAVSKPRPEPKQRRATTRPSRATAKPKPPTPTLATAATPETPAAADHAPSLPPAELAAMESHYLKNVRQRITEKRFYPRRARRMGQQGTVMLRLVLLPDGSIDKVSLAESSGTQTLDEAALAAVRRVGRFPPFPQGLQREDWVLTVPLRYSVM